jgi:ribosome recycling factor
MPQDFSEFVKAGESILAGLKNEYTSIHTGRAMPTILDRISVESYGSMMSINQLATVSIEDPKTLRIVPWDKDVAKNIDKAIRESNLGLSVALDAVGLRITFPELTSERRVLLSKVVKENLEEARIRVRSEREKFLNTLDRKEKEGSISEDEKFRLKGELQKLVDSANAKLEELASHKDKEISG